ncbi:MAG: ABC transporter ATP-binding protein [Candidatus Brocadiae bacterium]|nr:ABC transporter ATP-binding protein [Candidatus Brocadiia bacterium]
MAAAVEMVGIEKRFPRVVANVGVNLVVEEGEIHALAGENGAGKSTLMKILCGLHAPDAGVVRIFGREVTDFRPAAAIAAGIGMVHQHFMQVPTLTVAENVVLGEEPRRGPFFDRRRAEERVAELGSRFGLPVDPRARIEDLPVGLQQRVEILKVLARGARVLILDEPTAVLTPQESESLYATLRSLKSQGRTVIFISHKLREVRAAADRLTVLRRGRTVGTVPIGEVDEAKIAEMMIGRPVLFEIEKTPAAPAGAVLEVRDLAGGRLRGVTFDVRAGEIVGVAGVEGNGQSELVEILSGLRQAGSGTARLRGRELSRAGPAAWFEAGLGVIPEDRNLRGLIGEMSVADNLILGRHRQPRYSRAGIVAGAARDADAAGLVERFDIRPADPRAEAESLSGGNRQKVVVARELSRVPGLLVAAHPTRGVDVGAIEFIHRSILAERARGAAVLLVSSELPEILALADRILVLCGGAIAGEVRGAEATERGLGVLMTGGAPA